MNCLDAKHTGYREISPAPINLRSRTAAGLKVCTIIFYENKEPEAHRNILQTSGFPD